MKLVSLTIKKLHEYYDYQVNFNADITFLYGKNGCGKTTILNITEAIITGKLYNLFSYSFEKIKLEFINSSANDDGLNFIEIKRKKNKTIKKHESILYITFEEENYYLDESLLYENFNSFEKSERNISSYYFEHFNFLNEIKKTFNYVYLPLNRLSSYEFENDEEYYFRKRHFSRSLNENNKNTLNRIKDASILQVENIIKKSYLNAASTVLKYNDQFRNNLLRSFLEFELIDSVNNFFNDKGNIKNELMSTKESYIKILKSLNILDEIAIEKLDSNIQSIIGSLSRYESPSPEDAINTILHIKDILKIKKIVSEAERLEFRKLKINKPIDIFLDTMDDLLLNNDEKKIRIDTFGRVYFTTQHDNTHKDIKFLSSGEKQLITFFANFIFGVKNLGSSGIFVVDEPELSLHLSWQKKFVEKTLEINPNIQLIFATHSPEIVGRHRDKMYLLEKTYVNKESENE